MVEEAEVCDYSDGTEYAFSIINSNMTVVIPEKA